MKKIILFSFIFQCLFMFISLLLIMIKVGYGTELFAYTFYSNLLYFIVGFILNIFLVKFSYKFKEYFYLLFSLGVLIIFNIYFLILSGGGNLFSAGLFRTDFDDGWFINLYYHISILISSIIMYFLSKKGKFSLLDGF